MRASHSPLTTRPKAPSKMADEPVTEEWRIVEGWPDYEVSSFGRVRRAIDFVQIHPKSGRPFVKFPAGLAIASFPDKRGYLRVNLRRDGVASQVSVAVLVCTAFHGQPTAERRQAAHGDGNKTNNSPSNLRWASPMENSADRIAHGNSCRGERHPNKILSENDVNEIRKLLLTSSKTMVEIGQDFGITKHTVYAIKKGKNWGWFQNGHPQCEKL